MKVLIKNSVNVDDLWKLSAIAFNIVLWPSYSLRVLSQAIASTPLLPRQCFASKTVLPSQCFGRLILYVCCPKLFLLRPCFGRLGHLDTTNGALDSALVGLR